MAKLHRVLYLSRYFKNTSSLFAITSLIQRFRFHQWNVCIVFLFLFGFRQVNLVTHHSSKKEFFFLGVELTEWVSQYFYLRRGKEKRSLLLHKLTWWKWLRHCEAFCKQYCNINAASKHAFVLLSLILVVKYCVCYHRSRLLRRRRL